MAGTFDPPWSTLRQTWLLDSELNSGLITQCVARIHDRGTDQNGQRHDSKAYSLIELLVSGRPVLRYVEHHWRHVKYGFGRSFDAICTERIQNLDISASNSRRTRRVFDCCLFNGEMDVLSIRLHELNDVVDNFVIVESDKTFSGVPRDITFHPSDPRIAEFA